MKTLIGLEVALKSYLRQFLILEDLLNSGFHPHLIGNVYTNAHKSATLLSTL